jgi:large subunit ribosomal protein L29
MKTAEIKALSTEEIVKSIREERETLQRTKFAHAISQIENPIKIRATRRLIARLTTELHARTAQTK